MKIHWKPEPKQVLALVADVNELLFGGARGGGKTDTGQVWMIEPTYVNHPRYRGLVIRKNADDLKDWLDRARHMYLPLKAVFTGNPGEITFPSGAKIRLGHLKDANAYGKYQGHEYQKMLIEELTQIPLERNYEKLLGSCRSTVPELKAKAMSTTNPDGDGYEWVRDRFDCLNPDLKPRQITDKASGRVRTRLFVPSKIEDNPHLMNADPDYVAFLDSISDETLRQQWRHGSWVEPKIEGSYYAKQLADAESRIREVPYDPTITVDTWWDLGIGDQMAIWFTQMVGHEVHVIDYLEAEGEGIPYYVSELRRKPYVYGEHFWPHDGEARELTTGTSRKETAEKIGLKPIRIVPRLGIEDGIEAVRNFLPRCWFDREKCKEGLRALKHYRKEFDEKRNTWRDHPEHDWASNGSDAFRYLAIGHRFSLPNKRQYVPYSESISSVI